MERFVQLGTIGVRTYGKVESQGIASEKHLRAIDDIFRAARARHEKVQNPNKKAIEAIERWFELRKEHAGEEPVNQEADLAPDDAKQDELEKSSGTGLGAGPQEVDEQNAFRPVEGSDSPTESASVETRKSRHFVGIICIFAIVAVVGWTAWKSLTRPNREAARTRVSDLPGSPRKFQPNLAPGASGEGSGKTTSSTETRNDNRGSKISGGRGADPAAAKSASGKGQSPKTEQLRSKKPSTSLGITGFAEGKAKPSKQAKKPDSVNAPQEAPLQEVVPYGARFISAGPFKERGYPFVECNPGDLLEYSVTVKNIGWQPWTRKQRPISLGVLPSLKPTDSDRIGHRSVTVEWMDATGSGDNIDLNRVYLNLGEVVSPGATKTFHFKLRMPQLPGPYPITLQMVMDGGPDNAAPPSNDGWFAGQTVHAIFKVRDKD